MRQIQDLYRTHQREIFRFIRTRVGDPSKAEDLAQETFCRMMGVRDRKVRNARPYLFQVANNLVIDHFRSLRAQPAMTDIDHLPDSHDALVSDEDVEQQSVARNTADFLATAMADLSPACQRIFWLRHYQGYTNREIARRENVCLSTVEKNLNRARKHCLRTLETVAA